MCALPDSVGPRVGRVAHVITTCLGGQWVLPARKRPAVARLTMAALLVTAALVGCSGDASSNDARATDSPSAAGSATGSAVADGTMPPDLVPAGTWAGEHAELVVTPGGATAEFDCASGVVAQPPTLDAEGRFDLLASHTPQLGGPAATDNARAPPVPARYRGRLIDAQHLTLSVVLTKSGRTSGPFELELGGQASLDRCG